MLLALVIVLCIYFYVSNPIPVSVNDLTTFRDKVIPEIEEICGEKYSHVPQIIKRKSSLKNYPKEFQDSESMINVGAAKKVSDIFRLAGKYDQKSQQIILYKDGFAFVKKERDISRAQLTSLAYDTVTEELVHAWQSQNGYMRPRSKIYSLMEGNSGENKRKFWIIRALEEGYANVITEQVLKKIKSKPAHGLTINSQFNNLAGDTHNDFQQYLLNGLEFIYKDGYNFNKYLNAKGKMEIAKDLYKEPPGCMHYIRYPFKYFADKKEGVVVNYEKIWDIIKAPPGEKFSFGFIDDYDINMGAGDFFQYIEEIKKNYIASWYAVHRLFDKDKKNVMLDLRIYIAKYKTSRFTKKSLESKLRHIEAKSRKDKLGKYYIYEEEKKDWNNTKDSEMLNKRNLIFCCRDCLIILVISPRRQLRAEHKKIAEQGRSIIRERIIKQIFP